MTTSRITFDRVWKKFRKGEPARRLRHALPAMRRAWFGQAGADGLKDNEFWSLRDLSFEVGPGQCLGVIGHNGAGKSTLLKCASRIYRPNRGTAATRGRLSALIEVGAGFHPDLTGRENIYLNGSILGMSKKEVARKFDRIVEFSELGDFIDTPVKRFSSGMYARLGFAVASHTDPDVLLVDEVLSVGDMSFGRKCEARMKEILATGTTVMFVSHNLAAVRMLCDRVIVLRRGQVCFDGDPDQALHVYHDALTAGDNLGDSHPALRSLQVVCGDELGEPCFSARTGDVMTLDLTMTAARDLPEASLGFFVSDEQHNELYRCTMEHAGAEPADLRAGQELSARFRFAANLVPGNYWIGSTVTGRPELDRQMLDRNPHRLQVTVTGAGAGQGHANLFAECETAVARPELLAAV